SWWSYQTDVNLNIHAEWFNNWNNRPTYLGGVGYDAYTMLAAASAFQVRDPKGKPVDTRIWKGNFPGACGGGWQLSSTLVTPDEVAEGKITHAFCFVAANTM